jgi:uncharacterized Zn finger protein (UPF0148 family)
MPIFKVMIMSENTATIRQHKEPFQGKVITMPNRQSCRQCGEELVTVDGMVRCGTCGLPAEAQLREPETVSADLSAKRKPGRPKKQLPPPVEKVIQPTIKRAKDSES